MNAQAAVTRASLLRAREDDRAARRLDRLGSDIAPLDADEVCIPAFDLDDCGPWASAPASCLDANERERERRDAFVCDVHRRRVATSRTILRSGPGRWCGISSAQVRLGCGEHGRPALAQSHAPRDFNVSHSGGTAVIASPRSRVAGTDMEIDIDNDIHIDIDIDVDIEETHVGRDATRALASVLLGPPESAALLIDSHPRFLDFRAAQEACARLSAMGLPFEPRAIGVHGHDARCGQAPGHAAPHSIEACVTSPDLGACAVCALATSKPPRRVRRARLISPIDSAAPGPSWN